MAVILGSEAVSSLVDTLASQLAARMADEPRWALVGIRDGGTPLAEALAHAVSGRTVTPPLRGAVDITLYRDDLYSGLEKPVLGVTKLDFSVNGTAIVLVDDVLFTGRTVRAAMGEVWDFGRPKFIQLLTLVDRGHRELPIAADLVGVRLDTAKSDRVVVDWQAQTISVESRKNGG